MVAAVPVGELIGARVDAKREIVVRVPPVANFTGYYQWAPQAFGKFLKQMGTAIYNTRTFAVYGEGPTKMGVEG